MNKTVLICEGYNDRIFLHETLTNRMTIDPIQVKTYSGLKSFTHDVRSGTQKNISVTAVDGPISPKFPVRFVRQFWYIGTYQMSLGVISDLDRGEIYEKMVAYLNEYLNTKCKKHNINPELTYHDSEKKLRMCFESRRTITIWTFVVPENLEAQISMALKHKHPELKSIKDEDETIRAAITLLGTSRENIIRSSVSLLANEKWLTDLCRKFNNRF